MKFSTDVPMTPAFGPPNSLGSSSKILVDEVQTNIYTGTIRTTNEYTALRHAPTSEFGKETPGTWNAISADEPLKAGDIVRFGYRFRVPFFEEWQTNQFLSKLQKDDRFEIRHWSLSEEEGLLWIEVKIRKQDFGLTAILVAGAIAAVGIGIGFFLVSYSIEKLGNSVKAASPVGFVFIMGGIALALFAFAKAKSA
jgi:hypothetical protein